MDRRQELRKNHARTPRQLRHLTLVAPQGEVDAVSVPTPRVSVRAVILGAIVAAFALTAYESVLRVEHGTSFEHLREAAPEGF